MITKEKISEMVNEVAISEAEQNWNDTGVCFTTTIGGCDIEVDAPFDFTKPAEVYIIHKNSEHVSLLLAQYIADNIPDLGYIARQAQERDYQDIEDEHMLHRSLERQFLPW